MKERMIEKGYTTKSLAGALGLDNSTVWRWVNGKGHPGPTQKLRLIQLGLMDGEKRDLGVDVVLEKLKVIEKMLLEQQELRNCLFWYVDTDESTEEDEFYWEGKQRALRALGLK